MVMALAATCVLGTCTNEAGIHQVMAGVNYAAGGCLHRLTTCLPRLDSWEQHGPGDVPTCS